MSHSAKILCPVDFSHGSDYAMNYANSLAKVMDAEVHCAHVINPSSYSSVIEGVYVSSGSAEATAERIEKHVRETFEKPLHRYELLHLQALGHFLHDDPASEVVKLADELKVDYIMLTTHGHTGFDNWVFGSTYEKIVRLSHVPVITLKHPEGELGVDAPALAFKRILCPLEFLDFSKKGLDTARALCKRFGATLVLTHAVDTRFEYPMLEPGIGMQDSLHREDDAKAYLDEIAAEIEDVFTETRIVTGNPYKELVNVMRKEEIDMVVITTHGYRGLTHMLLGSNAERLVRTTPCPVMTIHPHQETKKKQNSELEVKDSYL
jgi:nucleotide-binding universal stress UspA family protein